MKLFLFLIIALSIACNSPGTTQRETDQLDESRPVMLSINGDSLFTLSDAEKILGEKAYITDRSMTPGEGVAVFKSTYTAKSTDKKSGKTGNVYFMVEQFAQDSSAKKVYTDIKIANENHGIKVLGDLGDEAYFHSDNENFYFILIRKRTALIRLKVNRITSTTSLDQFNSVARNVSDKI